MIKRNNLEVPGHPDNWEGFQDHTIRAVKETCWNAPPGAPSKDVKQRRLGHKRVIRRNNLEAPGHPDSWEGFQDHTIRAVKVTLKCQTCHPDHWEGFEDCDSGRRGYSEIANV